MLQKVRKAMGKNEKNTNLEDLLKVIAASGADIPVAGIRVPRKELSDALSEAGLYHLAAWCPVLASSASECPESDILSATDIINFRRKFLA